ncbi:MAG: hypothetical protein JXA94_02960 [Parachlamydiales bacterium]|nr:hypothetical protein [Parachlamydiales bacterium]
MFRSFLYFILLSLVLVSCKDNSTSQNVSRYYDDGRSRPVIGIGSVVDSTSYEVPWSISEELTQLVRNNLSKNKSLYLSSSDDIDASLTNSDNLFSANIDWMNSRFDKNEFVVFLELIKHHDIEKDNATNLDMSLRLRIVDIRSKTPKLVLQEVIKDNFYISKSSYKTDYTKTVWGSQEYENSRMGIAHKQLASQIADRISDYVSLSKSR